MNSKELKFGIQSDLSVFTDTLVEMTWEEVKASGERGDSVIFPIAVIEAHGPHMDLSADIYYAYLFSRFLKKNLCAKGINTVIVPPYYWGINSATEKYPGSFTVRPETFNAIMFDIFSSLKKWKLYLIMIGIFSVWKLSIIMRPCPKNFRLPTFFRPWIYVVGSFELMVSKRLILSF